MTAPSSTPRTSRKCCTPSDKPCKRLKVEDTPDTNSDVTHSTFDNDNSAGDVDERENIVEALPDDLLGAIFFGGFVDSLEVINTTSCISKGTMALAQTQVKMLDLRKCSKLTSAKLSFLVNRFPHLQELDLSYCQGIKNISRLQRLRCLKILKLCGTGVSTIGIDSFLKSKGAQSLEELDLSVVNESQKSYIKDRTVQLLAKRCPNLRSLKLAWCRGVTDAAVAHLVKLRGLVELDLQLTSITAEACKSLSQLTSLEKLDLSACNIGSSGIPYLLPERPRSKLKELELRFHMNLNETALKVLLTRTPRLEVLNVQCCELTRESIKSTFVPLQRRGVIVRMDRIVDGYYVPRSMTG
ncbi:F-box and leucine-rich repeat protein 13 [Fragilaria crotonensis]|nr:F-box and leucine-rich repeat protein 13 [Fragilaria crotonensis]